MRNPKDAKEWTDENVSKNKAPEQNSQSCFFDRSFCTPNQACWPTEAQWSSFNSTVNGKLIKVVPWANPCFTQPNSYKPKECAAIEKGESRKTRFNKEVDPLSFSCDDDDSYRTQSIFHLLLCSVYLDGVSRANAVGTAQSDNWAYCYSNEGDVSVTDDYGDSLCIDLLSYRLFLAPTFLSFSNPF